MASELLTLDQVRDVLETGLPDSALEWLIDEADHQITDRYGPHSGEITETNVSRLDLVFLRRQAATIAEVKQYGYQTLASAATVVAPATYEIRYDGWVLARPQCWMPLVQVRYTPVSTVEIRRGVLLDMVRLALVYEARLQSTVGNVSVTNLNRQREMGQILSRLNRTVSAV